MTRILGTIQLTNLITWQYASPTEGSSAVWEVLDYYGSLIVLLASVLRIVLAVPFLELQVLFG